MSALTVACTTTGQDSEQETTGTTRAESPGGTDAGGDPQETAGGTLVGAWIGPCCSGIDETNLMRISTDAMWWAKVHSRLFTFEEVDGNLGDIQGDLAETWDVSEDGRVWTINLRPDVSWHDGEPVTSEDVKFSF